MCSYAQGNFNVAGGEPLPPFVLQFYHPVGIVVKCCPEEVFAIHGCNKHTITSVLFNDNMCIRSHKVGKAILCLSRDGCDSCCLHDDLELDVYNLVDDAGLVEIMCATRCSGTSRRVSRIGSRLGLEHYSN